MVLDCLLHLRVRGCVRACVGVSNQMRYEAVSVRAVAVRTEAGQQLIEIYI